MKLVDTGRRRREPGEHVITLITNKQTQMKNGSPSRTTAAHKTQTKIQAWSSLVFHCCHSSFNPSEAPPWDSRPVSGAGVVHYQLLHRPRSVPTALGPAPLVTTSLPSLFDRLTLALSILILFFKKKLTLVFLIFLYSIYVLFVFIIIIFKNLLRVLC